MRIPSQSGVYGGWWGQGLGDTIDSGEAESGTQIGLPTMTVSIASGEVDPSTLYPAPGFNIDTTNQDYAALVASGEAGGYDSGAPATSLPATAITNAITQFARLGIAAVSPNTSTGACPAGYVRSGAACIPAGSAGAVQQIVPGVNNQTLLLIGAGILLLMMLSSSGGKRR